ncbi:MAG: ABC transporter ATP-binding protein [Oscillospiraceae bacterium]|nr:ABC transporter ATP-binding protein [Oscillospiraceae bacterium]MBR2502631.1 ABC transporter ATP-binding protein [Oscillospiraceae bacterium]
MTQKPIIEIRGLKKRYRMGKVTGKTLKADWQSYWARKHGRPDPNVKIGHERLIGQTFMALNGIDLKVYPGEAVGIIGINGAGKSTMLKLISRITAPTEGEIVIRGKIASMLEVGTGFNPELTGRENVYMNGTILGMKKAEIDAKMNEIIEFSECRDFIDTPVKRYSSGMYVKLAFSVAAHLESDIIIMDEVLAVGDVAFQKKCLAKMSHAAQEEGKTVLYVSHNMSTIRQLCTRCIVMKEGKIIFDGDVEEAIRIYSEESFRFDMKRSFKQPEAYPRSQEAALTSLEVIERDNLTCSADEFLKIRFNTKIIQPVQNLSYIVSVRYAGTNLVGTYISDAISAEPCENANVDLKLDLSSFAPGKYFCDVRLATMKGRTVRYHEDLQAAFGFEISDNEGIGNFRWDAGKWGYILLPIEDMEVTQ